jgi:hypothetical protein
MGNVSHLVIRPREDGYFHRTKILNDMAKASKTKVIVNYDCDVLFNPVSYLAAYDFIVSQGADFCFPYDGRFFEVPKRFKCIIKDELNLELIKLEECNLCHPQSVGGALFWNKDSFVRGGMENENFISWGFEDNERVSRFTKLGFVGVRVQGPLYHLEHSRLKDSNPHGMYYTNNMQQMHKIERMTKDELKKEIGSWSWI